MKSGICVAPPPPQRYEPYADFLGELIVAATDAVLLYVRNPSHLYVLSSAVQFDWS